MVDGDLRAPRRDTSAALMAELRAAGFDDAREIGRGGFGVVFRCRQRSLDRDVAVKVLTSSVDPDNLERFFREQRAMGRLSGHPNIVHILQVGTTTSGSSYLVMPYCSQDSVDTRVRRAGPLAWAEALRLGVKMCGALETAHRLDVLHRDVKPANILVTDYGEPQLTDFGIAHMAGAFQTGAGIVTGSPAFTAPEVLAGDPPTSASDVYSLGATLFCAITGHAPFERQEGEQVVAQFLRITTQPLPDLRIHDVPNDVCKLLEHAMARDAHERPSTAAEFGELLRDAQRRHGLPVDDLPVPIAATANAAPAQPPDTSTATAPAPAAVSVATAAGPLPAWSESMPIRVRHRTGNLPAALTSFVGRQRELDEAARMLSAGRLLTLTGIGGVGKTRLAMRVAGDARGGFPDGVWLVELGEVPDAGLVASAVSTALGLDNQTTRDATARLAEHLADQQLLLVLDNCEHVVETAAALADTVLRSCPGVQILATGREPLGVGGEEILRVRPMPVPDADWRPGMPGEDAVALFTQRAALAAPGFEITDDNRATVAQICQRLDGLPLPIELAAARVRVMSVEQILDRLTDRYRILTGGSRVAPSRQQTMRLCIDWSYGLCTAAEQRLWARLSVFAGSFALDAVESVCAGDPLPDDLLDTVTALVDKSILTRADTPTEVRYRILDILREYGQQRLRDDDEHVAMQRRHRDWYEQLAARADADWISVRQLSWIARLDREWPNFRDTLRFCLESDETESGLRIVTTLLPLWTARGLVSEARIWLDRLLALPHDQPTEPHARALYLSSVFAAMQGDIPLSTTQFTAGDAELAQLPDDGELAVFAQYAAGSIALYRGERARAVPELEAAVAAAQQRRFLFCHVGGLFALGLSHMTLDDPPKAAVCHQRLVALTEELGERIYRGRTCTIGGWAAWRRGDLAQAVSILEDGLQLSSEADDFVAVARSLQVLGWIEADRDHERRAAVLLGAAQKLSRDIGARTGGIFNRHPHHAECEHRCRTALGETVYNKQFRRGGALSRKDAVAYALGQAPGS